MRENLIDLLARIEVTIDYPEEDIEEIEAKRCIESLTYINKEIDRLLATADRGKLIRQGIKVVIVGKPNVGKSSLLNALLRENRAIVTDIPGTTRDIIEESLDINGVLVRILDTAGIRKAKDIIEDIGIKRSIQNMKEADLVLWVMDATRIIDKEDLEIAESIKEKKKIVILNKVDNHVIIDLNNVKEYIEGVPVIRTSAILGQGISDVEKRIYDMVMSGKIQADDELMITNIRHQEALMRANEHIRDALDALKDNVALDLVSIDIRGACDALGTITGESVTEDLIDKIFSEFCLGK
jgi:tRNA modification GTPase